MAGRFPYPYPPKHRRPFPNPDDANYLNPSSPSSSSSSSSSSDQQHQPLHSSPEILLKRRRVDPYGNQYNPRAAAPLPVVDWSKESTFALIDAWAHRFLSNGRRKLHSDQWAQVVRLLNEVSGIRFSEQDCRNRVDVLKKRYDKEKARLFALNPAGSSASKWTYFAKMHELMGTDRSERRRDREMSKLRFGMDNGHFATGEAPGDTGSEGDDDDAAHCHGTNDEGINENGLLTYGVLADSVKRFSEVCERMESNRKRQAKELESLRREFQMDLESRKTEIFKRVQDELAKVEEGYDDGMHGKDMDDDDGDDMDDDDGNGGNLSD